MRRFAMITHFTSLRAPENFAYYSFFPLILKFMPLKWIKVLLPYLPSHRILTVINIKSSSGAMTEGCAIMCPLLPEQFFRLEKKVVLGKIIQCCKRAKSLRADIVGLAAFTSIVGDGGEFFADKINMAVTTGNTYTAFLAIDSILRAVNLLGVNIPTARLVVIGATGDIGSICTKILSKTFNNIILVARNSVKLNHLVGSLPGSHNVKVEQDLEKAISEADIVLCVASFIMPVFDIHMLKSGSIFCDVSMPPAILKEIKNFRQDVLVYDGGKAQMPNSELIVGEKWRRLFPRNRIFGCLAETILLALEGKMENFSIGRGKINESKVEEMASIAKKHGFETAVFYFGNYRYTSDDLKIIRDIIHQDKSKIN